MKRVTTHTGRHSFAAHPIDAGHDIRTVQELLSHPNVRTTMAYTHVVAKACETLPAFSIPCEITLERYLAECRINTGSAAEGLTNCVASTAR